jgi:acetyl-CoA carboxylase biotin carboxyl carrier protein
MDLTNEDVTDILALLDSLPYDELDLQTPRFRLVLRRTADGWTQSTEYRSAPAGVATGSMAHSAGYNRIDGTSSRPGPADGGAGGADGASGAEMGGAEAGGGGAEAGGGGAGAGSGGAEGSGAEAGGGGAETGELVAVRAPLPGTFYRAPRPGAAPFVEVGSRVSAEDVVGIVETMKLMNSVTAGVDGTVAEICLGNAQFAANGATLLRISAD